MTSALDIRKARRPVQVQRRVNVDFPVWMIESLDREAGRLGVTRQSIIKVWIAERLQHRPGSISVPLVWFPTLHEAGAAVRSKYEISGGGLSLHWTDLDEDLSVAGLMAGADWRSA